MKETETFSKKTPLTINIVKSWLKSRNQWLLKSKSVSQWGPAWSYVNSLRRGLICMSVLFSGWRLFGTMYSYTGKRLSVLLL